MIGQEGCEQKQKRITKKKEKKLIDYKQKKNTLGLEGRAKQKKKGVWMKFPHTKKYG